MARVTHLADLMHRAEASNGTAIPSNWILSTPGDKSLAWRPETSSSGSSSYITVGSGTPEAAVTAPVGSLFLRTDGGAGTTLYVKESGTGNTGWVGVGLNAFQ